MTDRLLQRIKAYSHKMWVHGSQEEWIKTADVVALIHAEAADAITQLRGAIAAQDERESMAGKACGVSRDLYGCDWPEHMAEAVTQLRAERDALKAENNRLYPIIDTDELS